MVSLQEYMAFMISRETENVQSSQDVEAAFRALTSGEKPFISGQELYAVSTLNDIVFVFTKSGVAISLFQISKRVVRSAKRFK